jgi:hypothetical protein
VADGDRDDVDELLGIDAEQRGAEDLVRLGVDHELHEPTRLLDGVGTRHGGDVGADAWWCVVVIVAYAEPAGSVGALAFWRRRNGVQD